MKTIYQFGDSYGALLYNEDESYTIKNFVELAANQLNYRYVNQALGGSSNEMILNKILSYINEIISGDILIINFSFFTRGSWYDNRDGKIKSTNVLYSDMRGTKQYSRAKNEHVVKLVEYYLEHAKDYNKRIFTLINSTLKAIEQRGVAIFYIFVDESEWADSLLDVGTNIKFPNGFGRWLQKNKLHLEQEGHYTKGIQIPLASMLLEKTQHFKQTDRSVFVNFEDLDLNAVLSKPVKEKML